MSVEEVKSQEYQIEKECPLKRWTGPVSQITKLEKAEHMKEVYSKLIEKLRLQEMNKENDRYEFLKVHPHCGSPDGRSCC